MPSILIDTNLSVLLFVGLTDPRYIRSHKRLGAYDEEDFRVVSEYVALADRWLFCPNVLTETSNLIRQTREPARSHIAECFATVVKAAQERTVASATAVDQPEHNQLGLTDAVLLTLAQEDGVLLTVDLDLYLAALSRGIEAVNYNHDRERRYGL